MPGPDPMMEAALAAGRAEHRLPAPAAEDAFSADDLELPAGVCYAMPNGKSLYVHALSQGDWGQLWAWHEAPPIAGESLLPMADAAAMRIYQVILSCHQGPDVGSPCSFSLHDYKRLRQRLGFATVADICRISDSLSGQGELLGPTMRSFFAYTQASLRTWLGASSASDGCPPGLRDCLTRLDSLVSRALSTGQITPMMIPDEE